MAQWKPEDEQQFQELLQRAEAQARELSQLAPPPPMAPEEPLGRCASPPLYAAGGGGSRAPQRLPDTLLGMDTETLLILVLIVFLIRQKADQELILALLYILLF